MDYQYRLIEPNDDYKQARIEKDGITAEFTIAEVEAKTVVAVEVPPVAAELRPCFYKTAGLQDGAYIRVGNTNRHMTGYEIFGYTSARAQPGTAVPHVHG